MPVTQRSEPIFNVPPVVIATIVVLLLVHAVRMLVLTPEQDDQFLLLFAFIAARYDAIALTASLPVYDARFERMLTVGGRLFVVVCEPPVMDARLVRRTSEDSVTSRSLFETVIDPLVNAVRPPDFRF